MKNNTIVLVLLLGLLAAAARVSANDAFLTRYGPQIYAGAVGQEKNYAGSFRALEGLARLILENDGTAAATVRINGQEIAVDAADFLASGRVLETVRLASDNQIEVAVNAAEEGAQVRVRVQQYTESEITVRALMYFGINTSSMERQRAFYNTLGLRGEIFPAGPEECRSFARSLGFDDNYRIFVALTSFTGAPPWIDTVEFRDQSLRDDPPYARTNHIGMAYATYATTDLYGDYLQLMAKGVNFVSPPVVAPDGEHFVFLQDQDGTFIKLIQEDGSQSDGPDLTRLVNVNMNVADLQRSQQFYRLLGFTEEKRFARRGNRMYAVAHGFPFEETIAFQGMDISLPGTDQPLPAGGDPRATLQLLQWRAPFDAAPPYWPPVNHLGIDRIAFYVDDLNATIAEMERLGYQPLGPIGGGANVGDVGIVFYYDPDGIKVEFWGPVSEPNPDSAC
jgi:catechol 2,3-dioxygenase-like lactoylglutathione lyase family enzyme